MFFDDLKQIPEIAKKVGTSIFVVPRDAKIELPGAIILQPEEKTTISIEQVRAVSGKLNTRQVDDIFVVIRPADKMGIPAANSLLKILEQPGDKIHFVLITDQLADILPTILSRAALYYLKPHPEKIMTVEGDDKQKDLAKQLLVAKGEDLVKLAQEITNRREKKKDYTLEVLRLAIEMAYRAYFKTKRPAFLQKTTSLIQAYEKIKDGGNLKLQIVANLC